MPSNIAFLIVATSAMSTRTMLALFKVQFDTLMPSTVCLDPSVVHHPDWRAMKDCPAMSSATSSLIRSTYY